MQTIIDHFDAGAKRYPERVCVQGENLRLTYAEVLRDSHAIAYSLAQRGLRHHKRLPPSTEEQILCWADAFHARAGRWPGWFKSG